MKRRILISMVISALLAIAWFSAIHAAEVKLTAGDGAANDEFGYSVSISSDYAIVGAYGDDYNGYYSGSAYIFKRDGTSWGAQSKLLASDGAEWDEFGWSVSISGDYAIVGARLDNAKAHCSGSAYIFKRNGTSWLQQAKLTASDGAECDEFGWVCFHLRRLRHRGCSLG